MTPLQILTKFSETWSGENVSTKVERVRITLALEIRRQMADLFGTAGYLIRDHRQDAAVAAVNAKLFDEKAFYLGFCLTLLIDCNTQTA